MTKASDHGARAPEGAALSLLAAQLVDPPDNVYGARKRLEWILQRLDPNDRILDFGCGTGLGLTIPLLLRGFDVHGVDAHGPSVEAAHRTLRQLGLDETRIALSIQGPYSVVIASEVLEHIPDAALDEVVANVLQRLLPGGRLLITVPNGFGWFEIESALWFRTPMGRIVERWRIPGVFRRLKQPFASLSDSPANTLADAESPHVQRFTPRRIRRLLRRHGVNTVSIEGLTLVAGPFSNMIFGGIRPLMAANQWLGSRLTPLASGYLVEARADVSRET